MAAAIGVSAAYLSALEHGRRGVPTWVLLQKIIGYFNIIWDDAEELLRLAAESHPRVVIDTSGLSPMATELANLLARRISALEPETLERMLVLLQEQPSVPNDR
jgi:transcriptional regulator with XRE-family HTH domain